MYAVRCISGYRQFRTPGHVWQRDYWTMVYNLPEGVEGEKALEVREVEGISDPRLLGLPAYPAKGMDAEPGFSVQAAPAAGKPDEKPAGKKAAAKEND